MLNPVRLGLVWFPLSERVRNHDNGSTREAFPPPAVTERGAAGQTDAPSPAQLKHLDSAEQKLRFHPSHPREQLHGTFLRRPRKLSRTRNRALKSHNGVFSVSISSSKFQVWAHFVETLTFFTKLKQITKPDRCFSTAVLNRPRAQLELAC